MSFFRPHAPQTITAQITGLVIVAVVLGVGLASTYLVYFFYNGAAGANADILPAVRAARIASIVKMAERSQSPTEIARLLQTAHSPAVFVEQTNVAGLAALPLAAPRDPDFVNAIKTRLEQTWGIAPLPVTSNDSIVVKINDDTVLVFDASSRMAIHNIVLVQVICAMAIITFIILFLSFYAVRRITAPLSTIVMAARSFGDAAAEGGAPSGAGPREIAQVGEALNEMRRRVRLLIDERTHMLEAISHDLRTPLTRLRLRVERLNDSVEKENMLSDVAIINDMLGETLAYLRDGCRTEAAQLVDLPSLLQTICAQFTDVGHHVSYEGPPRLAFACRAQALTRAVTNVVDNATKHGVVVSVKLKTQTGKLAQIEVSDDGPGIPPSQREKVFEPFFKGDSARSASGRGGFGLGLSIARDIVRRHCGEIELLDHDPQGLTVRLTIGEQPFGRTSDASIAAEHFS